MTHIPLEKLAASLSASLQEAERDIERREKEELEKLKAQYGAKASIAEPFLASRYLHIKSCRVTVRMSRKCTVEFNFSKDETETRVI